MSLFHQGTTQLVVSGGQNLHIFLRWWGTHVSVPLSTIRLPLAEDQPYHVVEAKPIPSPEPQDVRPTIPYLVSNRVGHNDSFTLFETRDWVIEGKKERFVRKIPCHFEDTIGKGREEMVLDSDDTPLVIRCELQLHSAEDHIDRVPLGWDLLELRKRRLIIPVDEYQPYEDGTLEEVTLIAHPLDGGTPRHELCLPPGSRFRRYGSWKFDEQSGIIIVTSVSTITSESLIDHRIFVFSYV